jgi:hypothetical protein
MIIVSVKAPPAPAKCLCTVAWEIRPQVIVPEVQIVAGSVTVKVTTPENQTTSDIRLVLEYTIS